MKRAHIWACCCFALLSAFACAPEREEHLEKSPEHPNIILILAALTDL